MEMYKKPVMEIVELEKVDVLTCSYDLNDVKCTTHTSHWQCELTEGIPCHNNTQTPQ